MKYQESETLELKKSTSELKAAVVSVVAILNKHRSAEIIFGIKDNGTVVGQDISDKTILEVANTLTDHIEPKVYPEVKQVYIQEKSCLQVKVQGSQNLYFAYGRAYRRVGTADKQLSVDEIEHWFQKKHPKEFQWDTLISEKTSKDIDRALLKRFLKKAQSEGRIDYQWINERNALNKLGLLQRTKLLNAAEVLFCKQSHLELQLSVFAGVDRITIIDLKQFKGNVFKLLEQAENFIKNQLRWKVQIGALERTEIPEIPMMAIREALVNSFCHRDFFRPESNQVQVFKDRVEIYNPGNFPGKLTPRDYLNREEYSILRNPKIAELLYYSKDIERLGSGLKRIAQECRSHKVKVSFENRKTGFVIVFQREGWNKDGGVNGGVNSLWQSIKKFPGNRTPYYAKQLDVPVKTVEKWLIKLKSEKKIKYEGSSKTGGYYVVE